MNIAVCVKPVPDISIISPDPTPKDHIGEDDLVYIVNPCDLVAVEEAVRIKEKEALSQVILLSMAPPSTQKLLRRCLALGAEEAILLWDPKFDNSDCYATGAILAKALQSLEYDLVLCGNRAADTEAGQVGYVVASILGIPIVSRVTEIHVSSQEQKVMVERKLEKGNREKVEVALPALLAVDETLNEPRYVSLPYWMGALKKDIKRFGIAELGLSADEVGSQGSKTKVADMSAPKPRPKKIFTPDSSLSSFERMRLIMSGGLEEKAQDLFEGSPEELSQNFVKYLLQLGILEQSDEKV